MKPSLTAMMEVIKTFSIGGEIRVNSHVGVVTAFNDEHLFCAIPEIALTPDDIDLGAKKARDRILESYQKENRRLQQELERMINDRHYAEERQMQARRSREWQRERDYNSMDYGIRTIRDPVYRGVKPWRDEGAPRVEQFIDEIQFKKPSQQK